MMRPIFLSILFSVGIMISAYQLMSEYKSNKCKSPKGSVSYKTRYYSLWTIIFAYLIYMQWVS